MPDPRPRPDDPQAPTTRAAAREAIVRAEAAFVAAVEAQLAAQRTDPGQGAVAAAALEAGLDALVRARWGAPSSVWVRRTALGRVVRVRAAARECEVVVAPAGVGPPAAQRVRYGAGTPVVGQSYPVYYPVRLPDAPTPLRLGPAGAGLPWLKATGAAPWLYYFGTDAGGPGTTLWRVPLPGPPPFTYPPEAATAVQHLPGRPETANAGDLRLSGPGLATATLYLQESAFGRYHRPELAPPTYPAPFRLHRYPQFGATGREDPVLVPSSEPHSRALWTNLGPGGTVAVGDTLLGTRFRSTEIANITPYPADHYYHWLEDLIASYDGGQTWVTLVPDLVTQRQPFIYYPAGSVYLGLGTTTPGDTPAILSASGWVAPAAMPLLGVQAGDQVDTWLALYWPTGNPYPGDIAPPRLEGDAAAEYAITAWETKTQQVQCWVSRNRAPARPVPWAQPPGTATRAFLRSRGDGGLRGFWQGHARQVVVRTPFADGSGAAHVDFTASAEELWGGEQEPAGAWTWTRRGVVEGINRLIHVNADASVVLAARYPGPAAGLAVDSHWLSVDAGVTWRELPIPPYFAWDPARLLASEMRGYLVDLP